MQTGLRITAFAAGLAAAFGSAYAVGGALEPADAPKKPAHQDAHGEKERPAAGKGEAEDLPGGLAVSRDGFTLDLDTPRVEAGEPAELRFSVVDEDTSRKVTAFRREHGRELHLIVAWATSPPTGTCIPYGPPTAPGPPPSNCPRPAATASSPTSPRT